MTHRCPSRKWSDFFLKPFTACGFITFPKNNQCLQFKAGGLRSFEVKWVGEGDHVVLRQNGQFVASGDGCFNNISIGWYELALYRGKICVDEIDFCIGNVYVVAGQSNAVSHRWPEDYSVMATAPRKCILVDYSEREPEYEDAGLCDMDYGLCWIHTANARNLPYPMCFVIVAESNTGTYEWAYGPLFDRLQAAILEHRPRGVFWIQGEYEYTGPMAPSRDNMLSMVSRLKATWAGTQIIMALNSINWAPPAGTEWPIRLAQREVCSIWSSCCHLGPDLDIGRSGTHFQGDETRTIVGEPWAARMAELYM